MVIVLLKVPTAVGLKLTVSCAAAPGSRKFGIPVMLYSGKPAETPVTNNVSHPLLIRLNVSCPTVFSMMVPKSTHESERETIGPPVTVSVHETGMYGLFGSF